MPSLRSSPWMRGALQRADSLIRRIRARMGRPERHDRTPIDPKAVAVPFHHFRRFGDYQAVEDPRPHSVDVHP